ncbi:MAG: hypothetical protein ACRDJV_00710 [Actinomycetota bacterium]
MRTLFARRRPRATTRRHRALGLVPAVGVGLMFGPISSALAHGQSPHVRPEPATEDIARTNFDSRSPLRVPPDRPAKGLIFDGLDVVERGPNVGLFRVEGTGRLTHGPDAAPKGTDVDADVAPLSKAEIAEANAQVPICSGDGVSGKRTQVIYARSSDRPDRFALFLPSFRAWAAQASQIYQDSAAETGGNRYIRFVHNARCQITVANVVMPTWGDDTFGNTITALDSAGFDSVNRKYMIFTDANVYCGIGNIIGDDAPGAGNLNNGGPSYGRTDAGCWNGGTAAHEHQHNIGGVQLSAPHTSGGWHCVDEWDLMCYSDSPNFPVMQFLCPWTSHSSLFDCNHDDYYNTSAPAGSYLATHWNSANSQYLVPGAQAVWGYVWAHDPSAPSYTPSPSYQLNSKGWTNTIDRLGTGSYLVKFPGLGVSGGMAHATAYGSSGESCKVHSWVPSGTLQRVWIRCFSSEGRPVDTRFVASFVRSVSGSGPLAHVWADQPSTAVYTPSPTYQFNSTGALNTITRSGVGIYNVMLTNLADTGGNVKVTAYGSGSETCKVQAWGQSGSNIRAIVRCFTTGGALVDTRFTLTYAKSLGITGIPGTKAGYVLADQPANASYTPLASHQFNFLGGANTVIRSAPGQYTVTMPSLGAVSGHVQVNSVGTNPRECKVSHWVPSGPNLSIGVRCFTTTGVPADSKFVATFTR